MLWFSSIDSLTNYINEGRDRTKDPITSFTVFAHGTDSGTDKYAITFGLYTNKDSQLRWYISDISKINKNAFTSNNKSAFYACRTGNTFKNGNFAQTWANKTGGKNYAYKGLTKNVGRSEYGDILLFTHSAHVRCLYLYFYLCDLRGMRVDFTRGQTKII